MRWHGTKRKEIKAEWVVKHPGNAERWKETGPGHRLLDAKGQMEETSEDTSGCWGELGSMRCQLIFKER